MGHFMELWRMPLGRSAIATHLKQTATAMFPSLWVRWRLMNRAQSAEIELTLLKHIVGRGDITVDVGANLGLYTRTLAQLSAMVHAFEPSSGVASILRRTSHRNVVVHEIALSDSDGYAELRIPRDGAHLTHSLASLEPDAVAGQDVIASRVPRARLDSVIHADVTFVKVDVEGHELNVLEGAHGLIDRCRPVFLVESEERHRKGATAAVFSYFRAKGYDGFFLRGRDVFDVDDFDPHTDQDVSVLESNGGRAGGRHYTNNFFFFPEERRGRMVLASA
jgi:FkbM family methyltransferase